MISPRRKMFLAACALGFSLSAGAAPLTLARLMDALAGNTHGAAVFTEKKYLAILDEPVESSGELLFVPPARLEKRTLKPKAETLVLDGDVLTVERRNRKHVLSLRDYPEVAGMIESIRATLAGDRKTLERIYRLDLQGSSERWTLLLVPLDAGVGSIVTRIRMEGEQDEVRRVEILQADGDRSVMSIRKAAP